MQTRTIPYSDRLGDGTPLAPLATLRARHVRRIQVALGEALPPKAEGLFTMYVNEEISWADLLTVKEWLAWCECFEELHGPTSPEELMTDEPTTTGLLAQVFTEASQQANGRWTYQGRDRQSWEAEVEHLRRIWRITKDTGLRDWHAMRHAQTIADALLLRETNIRPVTPRA